MWMVHDIITPVSFTKTKPYKIIIISFHVFVRFEYFFRRRSRRLCRFPFKYFFRPIIIYAKPLQIFHLKRDIIISGNLLQTPCYLPFHFAFFRYHSELTEQNFGLSFFLVLLLFSFRSFSLRHACYYCYYVFGIWTFNEMYDKWQNDYMAYEHTHTAQTKIYKLQIVSHERVRCTARTKTKKWICKMM